MGQTEFDVGGLADTMGHPSMETTMTDDQLRADRDFEQLKYFFWTYLEWQDRIRVLCSFGVLPSCITQPQPQTLEHLALKAVRHNGELRKLWDMTTAYVPPEEQLPNPFVE